MRQGVPHSQSRDMLKKIKSGGISCLLVATDRIGLIALNFKGSDEAFGVIDAS